MSEYDYMMEYVYEDDEDYCPTTGLLLDICECEDCEAELDEYLSYKYGLGTRYHGA